MNRTITTVLLLTQSKFYLQDAIQMPWEGCGIGSLFGIKDI
ncbi:hypothetical protein [Iningainema tapete]|nr:hypothetical protein [Iningainema tapete]